MAKPHEAHWTEVKKIFRYLSATIDYGISILNNSNIKINAFIDSD